MPSAADPDKKAVLSLTARPDVYDEAPALVIEPLWFTPPPGRHHPTVDRGASQTHRQVTSLLLDKATRPERRAELDQLGMRW
ncbi:hypothetical protein OHB54_46160 [Streptomyces sp. NBC_01007]|nr:hypothetical protein OHB54_00090 [Streptomyces sp. NBC_01007]WRZ95740.1 hypothetical protein OHB54_46160 [Streptomyces sp. NBC_01007]